MTIEGNWIKGAVKNDFPDLKWKAFELPEGPQGQGHAVVHAVLRRRLREQEPGRGRRPRQVPLDRRAGSRARQGPRRHAVAQVSRATATRPPSPTRPRSSPERSTPRARSPSPAWTPCSRTSTRSCRASRAPTRRPCWPASRRTATPSSSKSSRPHPRRGGRPPSRPPRRSSDQEGTTMRRGGSARASETRSGWLFVSPVIIVLGLFLVAPIVIAFWVSVSDWNGRGSPLSSGVSFVGADNYRQLLDRGLPDPERLRDVAAQQLLLRAHRRADPDGARTRSRAAAQPAAAQGAQLLPHVVLLPVGDELGRDRVRLPLPLRRRRLGQRPARDLRHRRSRSGSPTRAVSSTSCSAGSGSAVAPTALVRRR